MDWAFHSILGPPDVHSFVWCWLTFEISVIPAMVLHRWVLLFQTMMTNVGLSLCTLCMVCYLRFLAFGCSWLAYAPLYTWTLYWVSYVDVQFLCPLASDLFTAQCWCVTGLKETSMPPWPSVHDDWFESETLLYIHSLSSLVLLEVLTLTPLLGCLFGIVVE